LCLVGCGKPAETADAESFAVESDSELIRAMHTYKEFLAGGVAVDDTNASETFTEIGNFNKFTLFDVNHDGIPELHIRTTRYYGIFTYGDDEMRIFHEGSVYDELLNNGALRYERIGAGPAHVEYRYKTFDDDGNLREDIPFEKWDCDENGIYDENDKYYYNNKEMSFAQWQSSVNDYLNMGSVAAEWADYPLWLMGNNEDFFKFESDNPLIRCVHTYKEFLVKGDAADLLLDIGDRGRFALFDVNQDGLPELHIKTADSYKIFAYGDDEIRIFYEASVYDNLSDNADLLFTETDDASLHVMYRHKTFDFDGNIEEVAFEKWDTDKNGEYDKNDLYSYEGQVIPFEQWSVLTNWRLYTGSSGVKWVDYPGWLFKEQG
jgi:protocatechuate 3,4-dioxygenase beta subunit